MIDPINNREADDRCECFVENQTAVGENWQEIVIEPLPSNNSAAGFRGILQLIVSDGACLMIATDGDVDYRVRRSNRVTNLLRG